MTEENAKRKIRTVGVVGAGVMGQGIIQVFVEAGFNVIFFDVNNEAVDRAEKIIHRRLAKKHKNGEITSEQLEASLSRLHKTYMIEDLKLVDLVVEAVYEEFEVKADIFKHLDKICLPDIIFASNTSSIPISKLAATTTRPDRFMGMHFMNPPTHVTLIELIRSVLTSDETFQTIYELSEKIGREPIIASKDYPAFVANGILMPAINAAINLVHKKVATVDAVNQAGLLGVGSAKPMRILELADLIGLDICLDILEVMRVNLGEKYAPCPLLEEMVKAGKLGYKSSEGFFKYQK